MKKIFSLGLALVVMLTLTACAGGTATAASTIAIDVNPSIVLELDEDDTVINVIMNNEDAQIIVGDMDLIGVDYNVAINALVGSMVANGYITELANSVLLSVSSTDGVREVELLEELAQTISSYLSGSAIEGSIITQALDFEQDAEDLAEQLNISEAKAELILDIVEIDPRETVEDLALLSIHDLNLLLEAKNYDLDNVQQVGTVSELGLITAEEAYQAALVEFGVDIAAVVEFEVELEQEDGVMVYEVEVETATDHYEILINAKDATVYVELDDDDDDDDDEDSVFPENSLTEDAVVQLVAAELGLDASLITELEVDQEMDNGVAYYEIEFEYEGQEYEVEADALTGDIYSLSLEEVDHDDDSWEDEDESDDETESETE